ncbi:MAG: hypothetical protein J6N78_01805 [Clostridia bacterium]|nr:hypothetical protein [Clostridia bacterium]
MSNLPVKYKKGVGLKIRNFFNKIVLFFKKEKSVEKEEKIEVLKNNDFRDFLRNDIKKEENINEIINIVEKHPEILDSLPISKLEKLDLIYDEKISKNQRDIDELIRKIENVNEKCIKLGKQ